MNCAVCESPIRLVDPADESVSAGFFAADGNPTWQHNGPGGFQRDTDHAPVLRR